MTWFSIYVYYIQNIYNIYNLKNFGKNILRTNKWIAGYKTDKQKSVVFLYTNNQLFEKIINKTISFRVAPKELLGNKFNEADKRSVHWKV